ncbi:hypothetical protein [Alicyclobacillus macrosporangiidus]|uniref:hypothetical protein n=1 Tax=Alicyclobacillus macrosporangiidus TaxID=392015 RepID=UPI0012DCE861|nr:hypothetical protein [Alicyclobacillus macrosporangiidus]
MYAHLGESAVVINVIGLLFAWIGTVAGSLINHLVPPVAAQIAACIVLCGLGWYILLLQALRKPQRCRYTRGRYRVGGMASCSGSPFPRSTL